MTMTTVTAFVGFKTQPIEIVEDARLVAGPAADAIVIFHAQQHAAAVFACNPPDVDGIGHVSKMEVSGG